MLKTKKNQNQIVKVTRLNTELIEKLDNIDEKNKNEFLNGYYKSRLAIKIARWEKGKAIDVFFRGVKNTITYYELEKRTGRRRANLKQWHNLYKKHRDMNAYQEIAEQEAADWTEKAYNNENALTDGETKQLPEDTEKNETIGNRRYLEECFRRNLRKLTIDEIFEFVEIFDDCDFTWWCDVEEYLHHRVCVRLGYDPDEYSNNHWRVMDFIKRENAKAEVRQKVKQALKKKMKSRLT